MSSNRFSSEVQSARSWSGNRRKILTQLGINVDKLDAENAEDGDE